MHPDVKDKILDRPRAKELSLWKPPEPSIAEIRGEMGGQGVSDDELLLRWLITKDEFDAMRAAGPSRDPVPGTQSILELLENLSKRKSNRVFVRTEKMTLSLSRRQ